ncbi:uncharacterized protein EI90DRAFT_3028816 [Cantharellus anzutake]|uniref:uncharacterized protein n=1 Tax=Cantharellus anzutake TaxID=1750568 RepID=UPI0019050935|nr:uncharacterized protein EI90DRAFT_3028816 [Cantharellus anzutake]KAF8344227.1 hypothetical protein EI90DRAFT_3028816 [Cantharellus anzutake]
MSAHAPSMICPLLHLLTSGTLPQSTKSVLSSKHGQDSYSSPLALTSVVGRSTPQGLTWVQRKHLLSMLSE